MNTGLLNTQLLNMGRVAADAPALDAELSYFLEVRNAAGDVLAFLPDRTSLTWRQNVNEAGWLQLEYPIEQDAAQWLTFGRQVWLRNGRRQLVGIYNIAEVTDQDEPLIRQVHAFDGFWQLGHEVLVDYEVTASIKTHLTAWFAAQANEQPVSLGYIDPAIGGLSRTVKAENKSIAQAIRDLHESVGEESYFHIDAWGRFQWRLMSSVWWGLRIAKHRNLAGISRKLLAAPVTRLYLYGQKSDGSPLTLVDAGEAEEYVENNTATYRTWSAVHVAKDIQDADLLGDVADRAIAKLSTPAYAYDVTVADLFEANPDRWPWDELKLGRVAKVLDSDLGLEVDVNIVAIERDERELLPTKIELANRVPDIADVIGDILQRLGVVEGTYGAQPYDSTPTALDGTGDAGLSPLFARGDHKHGQTRDSLGEILGEEELDFYARIFVEVDLSTINALEGSGSYPDLAFRDGDFALTTGEEVLYKRVNDAWVEVLSGGATIWYADVEANLESTDVTDGDFGYTYDDDLSWQYTDGEWLRLARMYTASTKGSLPTGVDDGALGRAEDTGYLWRYDASGTAWTVLGDMMLRTAATKGALPTTDVQNGEIGYITSGRGYQRLSGTWIALTHLET